VPQKLGATGVPFFAINPRYANPGAQPAAAMTLLLQDAWAEAGTS
jgi:predicted DsbA family dithiol-disulfide isomerase